MRSNTETVYITIDGQPFFNEDEATVHENKVNELRDASPLLNVILPNIKNKKTRFISAVYQLAYRNRMHIDKRDVTLFDLKLMLSKGKLDYNEIRNFGRLTFDWGLSELESYLK